MAARDLTLRHPTYTRVGEILAAPAGGRVSVRVDGAILSLPIVRSYAPTIGDQALVILQRRKGYVVGALGTAATGTAPVSTRPAPTPDDPTVATPRTGSNVFKPTWSGYLRAGTWIKNNGDLWQGDPNGRGRMFGAAFYGGGPFGLRGSVCTRARVRLTRMNGGSQAAPTLRLLTEKSLPAGTPTIAATQVGPSLYPFTQSYDPNVRIAPVTVTYALPTSWGQDLIDGVRGGIGIWVAADTPVIELAPIDLLLDWRKDT